jgi:protoporphyrinogen oxidase
MTSASTAIMANHVEMVALTLKKEMAIESKKMAGIVIPRTKKNRMMAVSWIAVKRSLPTARVAA